MGGKQSTPESSNNNYNYRNNYEYENPRYQNPSRYETGTSSYDYNTSNQMNQESTRRAQSKYKRIDDNYHTLPQVTEALAQAGLESSNLIVGIDFTKSNEWTGKLSFGRKCLHHIGNQPNPYEQAISIIGRTLSVFDEDNLIPCFGFGDASTHDQEVFSFYPDNRPCDGFEEALNRYREIIPNLRLAGPTSFAPIIETAIGIVDSTGGQYHVLLIIADGQVTRSVDTQSGQLSPQERATIAAIVKASQFPLSIVVVGVGDGPWDMMREFDDNIPSRAFDNFQFVNFTEIMSKSIATDRKEAEFALAALMEIPSQYKATIDFQLLGSRRGIPQRVCLPPPSMNTYSRGNSFNQNTYSRENSFNQNNYSRGNSFNQRTESPAYTNNNTSYNYDDSNSYRPTSAPTSTYASEASLDEKMICPICMWKPKDLAFGCGHQTCYDCGKDLQRCPICQSQITTKIRLY